MRKTPQLYLALMLPHPTYQYVFYDLMNGNRVPVYDASKSTMVPFEFVEPASEWRDQIVLGAFATEDSHTLLDIRAWPGHDGSTLVTNGAFDYSFNMRDRHSGAHAYLTPETLSVMTADLVEGLKRDVVRGVAVPWREQKFYKPPVLAE